MFHNKLAKEDCDCTVCDNGAKSVAKKEIQWYHLWPISFTFGHLTVVLLASHC